MEFLLPATKNYRSHQTAITREAKKSIESIGCTFLN